MRAGQASCDVLSRLLMTGKQTEGVVTECCLPAILSGQNGERSLRRAKAKSFHFSLPSIIKKTRFRGCYLCKNGNTLNQRSLTIATVFRAIRPHKAPAHVKELTPAGRRECANSHIIRLKNNV